MGETLLLWPCLHISMITMRMASFKHMISSRCSSWTCTLFLHSSSCWCLEDTHEGSLHLHIQDILVIGSIHIWPTFGSLLASWSSLCWEHRGLVLSSCSFSVMCWEHRGLVLPSCSFQLTCVRAHRTCPQGSQRWYSSLSSYFNLDTNIWFKHWLWTNLASNSQCKH